MADAQKYTDSIYGLQEDFGDLSPADLEFYWQMTAPKKLGMSEAGKEGAALQRMGGFGPAPRITPVGDKLSDNILVQDSDRPSKHVNIRDRHHWTESPISARREVPVLNLKEQRILMNPMLNQLANNVFSMTEAAGALYDKAQKVYEQVSSEGFDFGSASDLLVGAEDSTKEENKKKKQKEDATRGKLTTGAAQGLIPESTVTTYADPMNPYSVLYTTKPTQFKYTLPYMQNTYVANTGQFGGTADAGNLVSGLSDAAAGVTKLLQTVNLRKMFSPGRMIEEPKAFSFTGREKSYTVSFPLFNTKTYSEVVKNWQFIYLLSYQNTPNRVNRDLIDPPCIYEAYIPGVWYSKYAALTNMTVDFVGARREMYIPVPFLDHAENQHQSTATGDWRQMLRKALTVIPDAYQVTLTFTELFAETQNMKHQMLRESMNDKIRTGVVNNG